jgi:predicted transcriptional regulator
MYDRFIILGIVIRLAGSWNVLSFVLNIYTIDVTFFMELMDSAATHTVSLPNDR